MGFYAVAFDWEKQTANLNCLMFCVMVALLKDDRNNHSLIYWYFLRAIGLWWHAITASKWLNELLCLIPQVAVPAKKTKISKMLRASYSSVRSSHVVGNISSIVGQMCVREGVIS